MTRRFFTAKPLTSTVPGNSLSMSLSLSQQADASAPVVDTSGLINPDECPPGCVEDIDVLGLSGGDIEGWVTDYVYDRSPFPNLYPIYYIAAVGGVFCGSIDDITWDITITEGGTSVAFDDYWYGLFSPLDLTGPRLFISINGGHTDDLVITLIPKNDGVTIGGSVTLTVVADAGPAS